MTEQPLDNSKTAADGIHLGAILSKLGPLVGLLLVFTLFASLNPRTFASGANFELMLRHTTVVGIAALGMTMIIISGGIDLSVGSVIALSMVVLTHVLNYYECKSPLLAAVAAIGAAAVCGLLLGFLISVVRLSPFIASLGLWGALRGVAKAVAHNQSVYPLPEFDAHWRASWLGSLLKTVDKDHRWMLFPAGVWIMIALAVLVAAMLRYTRFGRHVFAIGSNEQTARLCGVNVRLTKLLIYLFAAILVGIAAVMEFSYEGIGDPTARMGAELDVIAAVVIGGASLSGGQGSIVGSLIGALMMTMVANGCTKMGWPNPVQEIVTGAIIILAATIDRLRHRSQ
jgi:ribose/xylose/arabinose/galactoside ABC-type transport system permease subunit